MPVKDTVTLYVTNDRLAIVSAAANAFLDTERVYFDITNHIEHVTLVKLTIGRNFERGAS